jgi:VanZ family protein
MILFGLFFVVTVIQFDRIDRRALAWSLLATAAMGLLVELEEGATSTGNCRITDVLPDLLGALVAMAVVVGIVAFWRRVAASSSRSRARRAPAAPRR